MNKHRLTKSQILYFLLILVLCDDVVGRGSTAGVVSRSSKMISPRRNHGCVMFHDEKNEATKAILVAGRWSPNIEQIDLQSQKHRLVVDHHDLLEVNHISVELVNSLDDSTKQEIWIMCGFSGHVVNNETTIEHVVIIDANDWTIKQGPKLDLPRGACTSFQFDGPKHGPFHYGPTSFLPRHGDPNLTQQGRLLCVLGGFVGQHDKGDSVENFSCWDRIDQKWIAFPPLPIPLDHHNSVLVRPGICESQSRQSILVMNGRTGPYGESEPQMFELSLGDQQWNKWDIPSPFAISAGIVVLSSTGKLISIGGVNYQDVNPIKDTKIRIFDICNYRYCEASSHMIVVKWALWPCFSSTDNTLILCGGASPVRDHHKNHPFCEAYDLPGLETECEGKWSPWK